MKFSILQYTGVLVSLLVTLRILPFVIYLMWKFYPYNTKTETLPLYESW